MRFATKCVFRIVALMPIALMAAACHRRPNDFVRAGDVAEVVADAVGDWFWWHLRLPPSFDSIRPYFDDVPPEWRPLKGWKITFKVVKGKKEDYGAGGDLSLLEVDVRDGAGRAETQVCGVDLRDPRRLIKAHYTAFGPTCTPRGLAYTERNVECAVAEAVFEAKDDVAHGRSKTLDVGATAAGRDLRAANLLDRYAWHLGADGATVWRKGSTAVLRVPPGGAAEVNARVPPLILR